MDRDENIARTRVAVTLGGVELSIVTTDDPNAVKKLALDLDAQIEAIKEQSGVVDTSRLLALALLNIAKEMEMIGRGERGLAFADATIDSSWIDELSIQIEAAL